MPRKPPSRPFDGTSAVIRSPAGKESENSRAGLRARTKTYFQKLKRAGEPIWWVKTSGNPFGGMGTSDFIVCYGGLFGALELKAPGGEPTPRQARTLDEVEGARGLSWVADSDADVTVFVNVLRFRSSEWRHSQPAEAEYMHKLVNGETPPEAPGRSGPWTDSYSDGGNA
jgi:hypothetical protein